MCSDNSSRQQCFHTAREWFGYRVYARFSLVFGAGRSECYIEFGAFTIWPVCLVIDISVDAPDILGEMLGAEKFRQLRESKGLEHDGLTQPEKIAETYLRLHQQHRSVLTHELDLRAFSNLAWWNR